MEFVCGSDWGIGINFHPKKSPSYGHPEDTNPNLFFPDHDVSTNGEILSWIRSCNEHNNRIQSDAEKLGGCAICGRVDGSHHSACRHFKPRR